MNGRSLVAMVSVAVLAVAGCGGDDDSAAMSEADFVDAVADICIDTESDLQRIDEPETVADLEDTASEGIDVLTETLERLEEIEPPEDLADDFDDFIANVDDQIDALEDLEQAGADDDEAAANEIGNTLNDLSERRSELADDLDVDDCVDDDPEPTDTTGPTDTTESTSSASTPGTADAPATTATVPASTAPPSTSAPTTAAPTTAAPTTAAPTSAVPTTVAATTAPVTVPLFNVVDLSTVFVAPEGFVLTGADPAAQDEFVDIVAAVPALNENIAEMGVGVLRSIDGTPVATIVVGIAIGEEMPVEWKGILCTDGTLLTSADGYTGIRCPGSAESGVSDIFTLTSGDIGLSIASVQPNVPADLVADAFLAANP